MNIRTLDGLIWLVMILFPLILLQRKFHREFQAIFLILTRRTDITMVVFALIFFPGVLLHELSHYLMAKLLFVPTGGFSLVPRAMPNGKLRLGYVEVSKADLLRDSIIGMAPLIAGGLFISYAAIYPLNLLPLWDALRQAQFFVFWEGLLNLHHLPDVYLWGYLAFSVSSTMLPSESDRRAWLPLGVIIAILLTVAVFAGQRDWMLQNLAPHLNTFFRSIATIFGLSAAAHAIFILPLLLIHKVVARLRGIDIVV